MTYFAESEIQAVKATQLIAQAFDKPGNCTKKPTIIRPKLEYIEFFERHTRAAYNVAQVFSFLVFRCQRNKPGDGSARLEVIREGGRWGQRAYWYLHTPKDIARECGKSVDKVESALKILKRLNLIEARAGRHPVNGEVVKYRGLTVTHIRLGVCQRANGLDCWPSVDQITQMRIIPGMAEAVPISSAEAVLLLPDASEGLDAEEVKVFVQASPDTETQSLKSQVQSGKDEHQTQTPLPGAVKKAPKFCTATEKNSAGLLWESLIVQYQSDHALSAQVRDPKIARDLCARLDNMADLPGHEPVLRWAVQNWELWAKPIGYADQVSVRSLSTRLDTAVSEYRLERQRLAEKAAYAQKMQQAAAQPIEVKEDKMVSIQHVAKKKNKFAQQLADEISEKAAPAAAPAPAPVVDPDDETGEFSWQDQLDQWAAMAAQAKKQQPTSTTPKPAPKVGPTMFQHLTAKA